MAQHRALPWSSTRHDVKVDTHEDTTATVNMMCKRITIHGRPLWIHISIFLISDDMSVGDLTSSGTSVH